MSRKLSIAVGCLVMAIVSAIAFHYVYESVFAPVLAQGVGPGGADKPTGAGIIALLLSALGTFGFTPAALVMAIKAFLEKVPTNPTNPTTDQNLAEVVELTASFAALMRDRANRAAQRRFVFAMVDASNMIAGVETSHTDGVVLIKYSGYADPVSPSVGGSR